MKPEGTEAVSPGHGVEARGRLLVWSMTSAMAAGAAAIFATTVSELHALDGPVRVPWYVLLAACVIVELHLVDLYFRGETHSFSVAEIAIVIGLFFAAPATLVLVQLVGNVIAMLWQRVALVKLFFNLAQIALGSTLAIVVFHAIHSAEDPIGPQAWLAAGTATLVSAVVTQVAIGAAVQLSQGRVPLLALVESAAFGLLGAVANTALGLVAVVTITHDTTAGALLVAPIIVVFVAYRAYVSEHSKSEGLQFLYGASQVLNKAPGLEAGLLALLDFTRDTLHAELAEIVVCSDADCETAFVTSVGPRDERSAMTAVPCAEIASRFVLLDDHPHGLVVSGKQCAALPVREGFAIGSAMLVPLGGEGGLRGSVLVANEPQSARVFGKDELRLFETFAGHLATTLEKSQLSSSLAQLRALKNELAHQAYHDSLTGLANRMLFRERVQEALEVAASEGSGVGVLFIDLDDFKTVNDTMGHHAGDELLTVVAQRIAGCVGPDDTPARLGGDEFAVLLRGATHEAAIRKVAERILVALGDPIVIDGQPVIAHASIGIATHASAENAAQLMQNADVAMYTAKRNGKGRCDVYEPTLSLSVARRHQVKIGLERALLRNELLLHYQPVVDVATGQIVATEALLRWRDPVRGLLGATEFIGIAEETGLIIPIGRFVIRESFRQAKIWEEVSPDLQMFVNISARQLGDPHLVTDIETALSESGVDPQRVVLEVTETAMMHDIEGAKLVLHALKRLGVRLGIDDFGTGYSSLSYIRQLPIDVLKIAKPIVDAVDETPEDAAFVHGIVQLGHIVGLHVVAEGVERVEQSAQLVDMGCDSAQGHYYGRSLDPASVDRLLAGAHEHTAV